MIPLTGSAALPQDSQGAHGWMILTLHQPMAVNADLIHGVYRTGEALKTTLEHPPTLIEVHAGRPWFIVPVQRVFSLSDALVDDANEWTVTFRRPAGLGVHVRGIEGPYRGVVMQDTLKTQQGAWPILQFS